MKLGVKFKLSARLPIPRDVLVAAVGYVFCTLVVRAQQVAVRQRVEPFYVVEVQSELCFQLNVVGQDVGHAQGCGKAVVIVFPLHGSPCAFRYISPRLLRTHKVPDGIISSLCRLGNADVAIDVSHREVKRKWTLLRVVSGAQRVTYVFVSRYNTAHVVFV